MLQTTRFTRLIAQSLKIHRELEKEIRAKEARLEKKGQPCLNSPGVPSPKSAAQL